MVVHRRIRRRVAHQVGPSPRVIQYRRSPAVLSTEFGSHCLSHASSPLLVRKRAVLQPVFERVFYRASVDDRRLADRRTHGPIQEAVLLVVRDRSLVKTPFKPVRPNMLDGWHKQLVSDSL